MSFSRSVRLKSLVPAMAGTRGVTERPESYVVKPRFWQKAIARENIYKYHPSASPEFWRGYQTLVVITMIG